MKAEFTFEVKPKFVRVKFDGDFESDVLFDSWANIFDTTRKINRNGVLVDLLDMTGKPPDTLQRFEHGARVAKLQWGIGAGIALAVVGNEPIVDPGRFAEVVGANRGAYAKVFTDTQKAEDWLSEAAEATWAR